MFRQSREIKMKCGHCGDMKNYFTGMLRIMKPLKIKQ